MREITSKEAITDHGITAIHHKCNHQFRFRLMKNHFGYIQSIAEEDLWEDCHYHEKLHETYIIQKGSIICVSINNGKLAFTKYLEGDIFTFGPMEKHKIFMHKGAVMHVVKHGVAIEDDYRATDDCRGVDYTVICLWAQHNSIFNRLIEDKNTQIKVREKYSHDYKHFDVLIWQAPNWSTALFIGVMAVLSQTSDKSMIRPYIYLFLFGIGLILSAMSYVLYRLRMRQAPLGLARPGHWRKSASFISHMCINLEAGGLLLYAVKEAGYKVVPFYVIVIIVVCLVIIVSRLIEYSIYKEKQLICYY